MSEEKRPTKRERIQEVRKKAAEIEEGHRGRGNHDKADQTAKTARETIKGIRREAPKRSKPS